jgi:hypothetical protein
LAQAKDPGHSAGPISHDTLKFGRRRRPIGRRWLAFYTLFERSLGEWYRQNSYDYDHRPLGPKPRPGLFAWVPAIGHEAAPTSRFCVATFDYGIDYDMRICYDSSSSLIEGRLRRRS